ncbi:MAG: OmpH family outer membrane protein [Syntrophaceae bacterium]
MKTIIPALIIISVLIMAPAPASAQRIGFIDMEQIIMQSDAGKKGAAELKNSFEKKQQAIQKREAELEKEKEKLKQQQSAGILKESALKELEHDYTAKFREYQKLVAESNEGLAKEKQEFMRKMVVQIRTVVQKVGEKDGYNLIMDVNNPFVIYHSKSGPNMTARIISELNKSAKK